MNALRSLPVAAALTLLALPLPAGAAAAAGCKGADPCAETRSFVATITSFRTSKEGRHRVLTATVRFENRTSKPLTLGYVRNSGVALDDLGNRYVVPDASRVRGIGEVSGTTFEPKFTLEPGEGSDARIELLWDPGKATIGTAYELGLAVREIVPTSADQFRLGQEHALQFTGLGQVAARTAPGASPAAAAAAPASASAPTADPCGGSPRCYHAGTFVPEVMQVSPSNMTGGARHQTLTFNIRFRNVSDKPVILAYRKASGAGTDNFGNRYFWGRAGTHDTSVKGIGYVDARSADPQFALDPGRSRNASFAVTRYEARPPIGESFGYDLVIDELEILPGQQIRSVRQNSVSFTNLRAGSFASAAIDPLGSAAAEPGTEGAAEVAGKMIDLIRKKMKKD